MASLFQGLHDAVIFGVGDHDILHSAHATRVLEMLVEVLQGVLGVLVLIGLRASDSSAHPWAFIQELRSFLLKKRQTSEMPNLFLLLLRLHLAPLDFLSLLVVLPGALSTPEKVVAPDADFAGLALNTQNTGRNVNPFAEK